MTAAHYDVIEVETLEPTRAAIRAADVVRFNETYDSDMPKQYFMRSLLPQARRNMALTRTCMNCTHSIVVTSKYCSECGHKQKPLEADPTIIAVFDFTWGPDDASIDDLLIWAGRIAPYILGEVQVVYHLTDNIRVGIATKDGRVVQGDPKMVLTNLPQDW